MFRKIQRLNAKCFTDRLPTKDDASKLIYCVATIQEIQRVSCVAPSTLIHCPTNDVEVKDYKIPKDTMIVANLAKFMMDPEVFPEPEKFLPDRFIEHEGNKLKLKVNLHPIDIRKKSNFLASIHLYYKSFSRCRKSNNSFHSDLGNEFALVNPSLEVS